MPEAFSEGCLNLTSSRLVHAYAGEGRWYEQPADAFSRSLGTRVVCDDIGSARDRPGTWHAQDGQDHAVSLMLQLHRKAAPHAASAVQRFFVDLAANRPITYSNSRSLERDYGWRGLCIDGHAGMLPELARQRTCAVVYAIVSDEADRPVRFRSFSGAPWHGQPLHAMSGIVAAGMSNRQDNRTCWGVGKSRPCVSTSWTAGMREERRLTVTLAAVLRHLRAPRTIDFLSLDVEGAEESVLLRFPFDEWQFRVLSIERPSDRLRRLLITHGYGHVSSCARACPRSH